MKIFVGQIYIKAGVAFPFSLGFQKWLGDALSERVEVSAQFTKDFGAGFNLGLRISAKEDIEQPEIKGPTVFKRDKNVEFTIFLPHRQENYNDLKVASGLLLQLLQSTVLIIRRVGLDETMILRDMNLIQDQFTTTPNLLA